MKQMVYSQRPPAGTTTSGPLDDSVKKIAFIETPIFVTRYRLGVMVFLTYNFPINRAAEGAARPENRGHGEAHRTFRYPAWPHHHRMNRPLLRPGKLQLGAVFFCLPA
jgi:hypothetical protein